MPTRSIAEAHSEIERELQVRHRCYVDWVARGKMSRTEAIDRFERLECAMIILQRLLNASPDEGDNHNLVPQIKLNWPQTTGISLAKEAQ